HHVSMSLDLDIRDTLALRASIIQHTALAFRPHLFLVDGEPLGLLGEIRRTLDLLKRRRDCRLVLGLHDVLDDPTTLSGDWRRNGGMQAVEQLYDDVWIYGLPEVYDPVRAYGFSPRVSAKTVFTGYLGREPRPDIAVPGEVAMMAEQGPFQLV